MADPIEENICNQAGFMVKSAVCCNVLSVMTNRRQSVNSLTEYGYHDKVRKDKGAYYKSLWISLRIGMGSQSEYRI